MFPIRLEVVFLLPSSLLLFIYFSYSLLLLFLHSSTQTEKKNSNNHKKMSLCIVSTRMSFLRGQQPFDFIMAFFFHHVLGIYYYLKIQGLFSINIYKLYSPATE